MARFLLDPFLPDSGDGRGAPQVALGPAQVSTIGSPLTLVRYPDRGSPGKVWTCLFAELRASALDVLERCAGGQVVWPSVAVVGGRQTVWDGLTNVAGAKGATVGNLAVSWVADAAGVHVCVASNRWDADPDMLLRPLQELELLHGWATDEGQERRWVLANLEVVAPLAAPPPEEPLDKLKVGLAHLCGYATVAAMLSTGGYDPTPHVGRAGNVEFRRVRQARHHHQRLLGGQLIYQTSTADGVGGVLDVLRSGLLLSQRRRRVMGVRKAPHDDRADREAGYSPLVTCDLDEFGRLPSVGFVWSKPARLLGRLDFGAIAQDPVAPGFAGSKLVRGVVELDRSCQVLDSQNAVYPQVAVADSLDLYGPHGPDRVVVRDNQEQVAAIRVMTELGVSRVGGRPVSQAVEVNPALHQARAAAR